MTGSYFNSHAELCSQYMKEWVCLKTINYGWWWNL